MVSKSNIDLKRFVILTWMIFGFLLFSSETFVETAMAFDFGSVTVTESEFSPGAAIEESTNYTSISDQIKEVLQWTTGILALIMFFFLIWQFMKLGASGDNEQARKKAIQGILTSGIALSLFGGSSIIIGFFWSALSSDSSGSSTDGG